MNSKSAQIGRIVAAIIVVIFGSTVLGALLLLIHVQQMPIWVKIPNPAMPFPNARDTFNKAEALEKDKDVVDLTTATSAPTPIPATDGFPAIPLTAAEKHWHPYTLAEKDHLIAENAPAFAVFERGLAQQYLAPPGLSLEQRFPYYAKDRAFARLLRLRTQVDEAHGDYAGAMNSCVDAIKLGSMIPRGSVIIGHLVGLACEAIGRKETVSIIPHLTSAQAKAYASAIAEVDASEIPMSGTLEEEKWMGDAIFKEACAGVKFTIPMRKDALANPDSGKGFFRGLIIMGMMAQGKSPRDDYNSYNRYMNESASIVRSPWPTQHRTKSPSIPTDPVNMILAPVFDTFAFKSLSSSTDNRLLETALALQAYYCDHHAYPATLSVIAPSYLSSVPLDPFSNSEPLRYKLSGKTFVLYSVGPDCVDNGGTPIIHAPLPDETPASKYVVKGADDKGDIVWGVNW